MKHDDALRLAKEFNDKHNLTSEFGAKIMPVYGKKSSSRLGTFTVIYPPLTRSNHDKTYKTFSNRKRGLPNIRERARM